MKERRVIHPLLTKHEDYCDDFNGASPHRAGHSTGIHPEDRPRLTDEQRPRQQSQRPVQYQFDDGTEDDDALYDTPIPNSARRYQVPVTQGTQTLVRYHRQQVPPRRSRPQDAPPVQSASITSHNHTEGDTRTGTPRVALVGVRRPHPVCRSRVVCRWLAYADLVAWLPR